MKQKTLIFSLLFLFHNAIGQSNKQLFNDLVSKNDTLGQQQLLEKWEQTDNSDPELFVAYFNYYVVKSKKEILTLGQNPKGKDVLQISDLDSTQKDPVAFMYSDTYYDLELLAKGFDWIRRGIENHPNRLDMRFGNIYMLGQVEDYEKFTIEIEKTIDYSITNDNKWTWSDSKSLQSPKEFMLNAIQDYQVQLYNTGNDDLLNYMKRIAVTILKYYPDHIESLSNLSIVYMLQKEYDKALESLLKAERLSPKDYIVLSNIAQTYKNKGDSENAIRYYELVCKYSDKETKKYAQKQIKELKNR